MTVLWTVMLCNNELAIAVVHIFSFTRAFIYMELVHIAYLPVFVEILSLPALFLKLRLANHRQFSHFIKTFNRDCLVLKVTFVFHL